MHIFGHSKHFSIAIFDYCQRISYPSEWMHCACHLYTDPYKANKSKFQHPIGASCTLIWLTYGYGQNNYKHERVGMNGHGQLKWCLSKALLFKLPTATLSLRLLLLFFSLFILFWLIWICECYSDYCFFCFNFEMNRNLHFYYFFLHFDRYKLK